MTASPLRAVAQAHADAGPSERAARDRISPIAGQLRARVLDLVVRAGEAGLTATEAYHEYVIRYGEPRGGLYSISPRLSELERRGGWVEKSGQTRDRRAAYVATDAGRNWARQQSAA